MGNYRVKKNLLIGSYRGGYELHLQLGFLGPPCMILSWVSFDGYKSTYGGPRRN